MLDSEYVLELKDLSSAIQISTMQMLLLESNQRIVRESSFC